MKIIKIFNNNVVLVNKNEQEIIVTGKGIGFKKKIGDSVSSDDIEKVYNLQKENTKHFIELLNDIPFEHLQVSTTIIDECKKELGVEFNESIYISLTDHISNAIKRYEEKIELENILMLPITKIFKKEYNFAKKSLDVINRTLNINLPNSEINSITLHLVNEQKNSKKNTNYESIKRINEIINIIRRVLKIELDEESVYFSRFITHLNYFVMKFDERENADFEDNELFDIVKNKYRQSYIVVEKIEEFVLENYNYKMSQEDKLYLILHITKTVKNCKLSKGE